MRVPQLNCSNRFLSLFLKSDDRQSLLQIAVFQEDQLGSPAQVSSFTTIPRTLRKSPLN